MLSFLHRASRMFPTVRVSFSGPLRQTTPSDRYVVLLDVVPMDSRRYRYAYHRSSWLVAGKADPPPPARLYAHPDTPIGPDALRKQVISFEKVKLTNNEMDKNGQRRFSVGQGLVVREKGSESVSVGRSVGYKWCKNAPPWVLRHGAVRLGAYDRPVLRHLRAKWEGGSGRLCWDLIGRQFLHDYWPAGELLDAKAATLVAY
uniref:T-box domain-containing protein n=1 Tax=Anopheles merus TaxID=30066 RepID=A0A182UNW6_ANOME